MFLHKRIDQHIHVTDHHALNAKGQVATSGWRGCCIPDPHWCFFILRTTQSSPVSIQAPVNDIQFQGCTCIIHPLLEESLSFSQLDVCPNRSPTVRGFATWFAS